MSSGNWQLTNLVALGPSEQDAVRELAETITAHDGAEPLNEHSLLRLSATELGLTHVVATAAIETEVAVVGYAQVDLARAGAAATAEVLTGAVPDRGRLATDLLATAEAVTDPDDLLVWSRGQSPVGVAAARRGYDAVRELLTMRRSLATVPADRVRPPAGITVRTFVVGHDEAEWVALNAAAFASHPEQGSWTSADLADRLAQPWFDPSDFFTARDADGTMLGYHWTKLHPSAAPGQPPVGEVYVLGIAPAAQGRGLGKVLLDIGLRHLASGPAADVILYVEQDNNSAVKLYSRNGFTIERRDSQYRLDGRDPLSR